MSHVLKEHVPNDLDYRVHALSAALVYHRDVSRWTRLGRTTTDEEDQAFVEADVLDTAQIFETYLRDGALPSEGVENQAFEAVVARTGHTSAPATARTYGLTGSNELDHGPDGFPL